VLPVIYQNITVVENSTYFIVRKNGRFMYLSRDGNALVPGSWEDAQEFNFGLAAVKNNGKWGYINLKGEVVIPFQYRYAGNFEIHNEARIATVIREKNYMTIGTNGAVVAERFIGHSYGSNLSDRIDTLSAYKEIPFYGGEYAIHGYYFVSDQKTEKKGIVNFLGEYVVRPRYDEILTLEFGKDAIVAFRTGTLWGLLDYHAGEMLAPQYEKLEPLSYKQPGMYRVTKNGQTFTINEKGEKQ
jgi:WG containing repeat